MMLVRFKCNVIRGTFRRYSGLRVQSSSSLISFENQKLQQEAKRILLTKFWQVKFEDEYDCCHT